MQAAPRCHAREGHPVITDLREKFAALAITGSSAFADDDNEYDDGQ
jgi:hypothetical protein